MFRYVTNFSHYPLGGDFYEHAEIPESGPAIGMTIVSSDGGKMCARNIDDDYEMWVPRQDLPTQFRDVDENGGWTITKIRWKPQLDSPVKIALVNSSLTEIMSCTVQPDSGDSHKIKATFMFGSTSRVVSTTVVQDTNFHRFELRMSKTKTYWKLDDETADEYTIPPGDRQSDIQCLQHLTLGQYGYYSFLECQTVFTDIYTNVLTKLTIDGQAIPNVAIWGYDINTCPLAIDMSSDENGDIDWSGVPDGNYDVVAQDGDTGFRWFAPIDVTGGVPSEP